MKDIRVVEKKEEINEMPKKQNIEEKSDDKETERKEEDEERKRFTQSKPRWQHLFIRTILFDKKKREKVATHTRVCMTD
jgi:hypothetical protein